MKYYIGIVIILIILYLQIFSENLVKIKGSNNKIYYTRKEDKEIAVEKLVKIDKFLEELVSHIKEENSTDEFIQKKLNKEFVIKEVPKNSKSIGYTINKNALYICMRNNYGFEENYNRMYFVVMHELAHIITKSVGHTDEYWNNYKMVIKTAIKHKLYTYENYYDEPVKYCGKMINSSPYIQGGSLSTNNMVYLLLMLGLIIIVFTFLNNHKNDNKNIWQETIISKNIYSFISKLK